VESVSTPLSGATTKMLSAPAISAAARQAHDRDPAWRLTGTRLVDAEHWPQQRAHRHSTYFDWFTGRNAEARNVAGVIYQRGSIGSTQPH
jgi:hypothetical protein